MRNDTLLLLGAFCGGVFATLFIIPAFQYIKHRHPHPMLDREDIGLALFCVTVALSAMAFIQWGTL